MSTITSARQVEGMREILQSIEGQLVEGRMPPEGLEDFKRAVDDLRLRVWSILSAASQGDPRGSLERFRIRRATEICGTILSDLDAEKMSAWHDELPQLEAVVTALASCINRHRACS